MPTCPHCNGAKRGLCFLDGVDKDGHHVGWQEIRDCSTCQGTGEVDDITAKRIEAGRKLRRARLDKYESMREAAQRLGIRVVEYSQIEHGRLDHPILWSQG